LIIKRVDTMSGGCCLAFWDRAPPLALVALASLAGVPLELKPDPKASKDAPPTLRLASGCVLEGRRRGGGLSSLSPCLSERAARDRSPQPHPLTPSHQQQQHQYSDELSGPASIARYLLRAGEKASSSSAGNAAAAARLAASADPLAATRVDGWLDFAFSSGALNPGPGFQAAAQSLDAYLAPRSFLVGRSLTAADVAVWGALAASPVFPKVRRDAALTHLARWFDLLSLQPACSSALESLDPRRRQQAADAAAVASGGRAKADGGSFDVDLPGDPQVGSVVVRFPPEPSGFLHIGHAKAALLNQAIAEKYKGQLRVRFDDTNPSKEKDEYVENILKDMRDLGVFRDAAAGGDQTITYASDYFPQLAECAERLIDAGVLYADDTPVDQMREERMAGIESKCRNRPVAESKALFAAMQRGEAAGVVLRIKMDMSSANTAMRDPVAYRVNTEVPHWRTGTKYKVRGLRRKILFFGLSVFWRRAARAACGAEREAERDHRHPFPPPPPQLLPWLKSRGGEAPVPGALPCCPFVPPSREGALGRREGGGAA
jgi:glutamyl-tRNA synthetase